MAETGAQARVVESPEQDLDILISVFERVTRHMGYPQQGRQVLSGAGYESKLHVRNAPRKVTLSEQTIAVLCEAINLPAPTERRRGTRALSSDDNVTIRTVIDNRLYAIINQGEHPVAVDVTDAGDSGRLNTEAITNDWFPAREWRSAREPLVLPEPAEGVADAVREQRKAFALDLFRVGLEQGHCGELEAAILRSGLGEFLPVTSRTAIVTYGGLSVQVDFSTERDGTVSQHDVAYAAGQVLARRIADAVSAGEATIDVTDRPIPANDGNDNLLLVG